VGSTAASYRSGMAERERSLAFDRVAEEYDATRGGESRGITFANALLGHLPDGRVLEVGVGTGVVAAGLRAAGRDVVGVDLSRPMLVKAKERLGPCLAQADAARLPVADGAVAAACAVWVLHLVADTRAVICELGRVVRPTGRCVIVSGASRRNAGTDVEELISTMWRQLQPAGRPDAAPRLLPIAAAAGLRLVAQQRVWVGPRPLSPAELARRIEQRTFSILWEISEEVWRAEVGPVLAQVQRLPDPSRDRATADEYEILVFDR